MVTKSVSNLKNSVFQKKYRVQLLASLTVHLITLSHGIGIGWFSPALQLLQSPLTPLQTVITAEDTSWIGSAYGLGCLFGNLLFGILLNRAGRKFCLYLMALPHMGFWILVYFAQTVHFLYVARFLGGMTGGASYIIVPIFIGEVTDSSIRGCLSSLAIFFTAIGILLGFILATYLNYYVMPCIIITLPSMYLIATYFLSDTPQFLLGKGNIEAAETSYKFYKNVNNDKIVSPSVMQTLQLEFNELKNALLKGNKDAEVTIKDFLNKKALFAFLTAFVIIILNQLSGNFAFINYMSYIFAESGVTMDPNTATIIVGFVQIVGTYTGVYLVDRCGRRVLFLSSAGCLALGLVGFGLFIEFTDDMAKEQLSWVPVVIMNFIIFTAGVGVVALLFVVVIEVLPAKIRSSATSICMGFFSCIVFTALKIYPLFIYNYGVAFTMFFGAGVTILSFIYLLFFLPETKGISMNFD